MGREIRRVPPDWDHPRETCKHQPWNGGCDDAKAHGGMCLKPLLDKTFQEAAREWMDEAIAWDNNTHPESADNKADHPFYWQWAGAPPDPDYYRPEWTSEPTHYQVYETVSEGTPVTPHFATKQELIDYLVNHGDEWDRSRGHGGWTRENATSFVERAWAPSMVAIVANGSSIVKLPRDGI